jgi:periplasmic protein TonB
MVHMASTAHVARGAALNLELPWSSSIDDDKRFSKILLGFLVAM